MSIEEGLTRLVEIISPAEGAKLRSELDRMNLTAQDRILGNSIAIHGSAIVEQSQNQELRPIMRDRLVTSLFQSMLDDVRKHPSFLKVEMIQADQTHAITLRGERVKLTEADYNDKLFSFDRMERFLQKQR
jgi:hypothetical protein